MPERVIPVKLGAQEVSRGRSTSVGMREEGLNRKRSRKERCISRVNGLRCPGNWNSRLAIGVKPRKANGVRNYHWRRTVWNAREEAS